MNEDSYFDMSDRDLLALAVWREAGGESSDGQLGVACCVMNRVNNPGWWGNSISTVILKPWQFSSFNSSDPNSTKWPDDGAEPYGVVDYAMSGVVIDPTYGATHYFDTSIEFPRAWGSESEWENTINIGRLRFWRMRPVSEDPLPSAGSGTGGTE